MLVTDFVLMRRQRGDRDSKNARIRELIDALRKSLWSTSRGRPDVLVDVEQVGRIVFLLERSKATVVVAVGRLNALLTGR
jgi:hypothetical protein